MVIVIQWCHCARSCFALALSIHNRWQASSHLLLKLNLHQRVVVFAQKTSVQTVVVLFFLLLLLFLLLYRHFRLDYKFVKTWKLYLNYFFKAATSNEKIIPIYSTLMWHNRKHLNHYHDHHEHHHNRFVLYIKVNSYI